MRTLALLSIAIYAIPAFGWGPKGHRLVVHLAQSMMTPSAKARMSETLWPREAIAALASWPDEIRLRRKDTESWHFVNIEITRSGLDMTRDCSHNNCVVAKITDFRKLWRDGTASPLARREGCCFWCTLWATCTSRCTAPITTIGAATTCTSRFSEKS